MWHAFDHCVLGTVPGTGYGQYSDKAPLAWGISLPT